MKIRNTLFVLVAVVIFASCDKLGKSGSNVALKDLADSASYCIGTEIAMNFQQQKLDSLINKEAVVAGLLDQLNKQQTRIPSETIYLIEQKFFTQLREKELETQFGEYRKQNEKFLEDNKSQAGVKVTASGLQYLIMKEGKGAMPMDTDQVTVHYHGTMIDGSVFDSSVDRKEPVTFGVNGVIPGWTEALKMMPVGSKWKLFIPYQLGYGDKGQGQVIKPYSTLIFEVELLKVIKVK